MGQQATTLPIAHTIAEIRTTLRELRRRRLVVGLVPTMGALHEGHLSLVRAARAACDAVVVSIFVNPTQFGPNEDFAKYPRTFGEDCAALEREGVHLVFAPAAEEMYLGSASTYVDVEGVSERLDGASRPGHFRGVATVVAKLFNIVQPDKAFFGQKDAAQVAVLKKMVRELNFGLDLVVCPIVREPDGLAMSSRNRYLSAGERAQALVLSRALREAEQLVKEHVTSARELLAAAAAVMAGEPGVRVDYLRVVNPDTLEDVADVRDSALVAVAAFVGTTRLIDNLLLPARQR
ncbi:MAG TPA: pantoate--beta-alanine ligase [Acidobacteriaceae bacterium]|nr:pantoate--beta-alanine ligase [Acidobacteriaceae bacterium]